MAAWRVPSPAETRFVLPAVKHDAQTITAVVHRSVELPTPTASAHASSIAVLPDGSLRVAWFGGAKEGAADVGIWIAAIGADGAVGDHWLALSRGDLQRRLHRVIRILGNPVVWCDPNGVLRMWVVSVSYGGWSGSAISALDSGDGGRTWDHARRLVLSPMFNLSTLVRAQPVPLSGGATGLPAYHELGKKWGLWVRLDGSGHVCAMERLGMAAGNWLQPSVAPLDESHALALLRCATAEVGAIGSATTSDGGGMWNSGGPIGIPNPDSGLAVITLHDGSLLLAANPSKVGRARLQLFRSRDRGATWTPSRTVAQQDGAEYSYPCLVESPDGVIHLSYTRMRRGISLVSFTSAWLDEVAAP